MTTSKISGNFDRSNSNLSRLVAVGALIVMGLAFLSPASSIAQTSNTSIDADRSGDMVADTTIDSDPENGEEVSLDFLNEGKNPKSVAQLRLMQDHVRDVADRVKEATVNINMGMGQGTGVIVSSDGIILTAAHVIERPRQIALITLSDGSQARARTLGVEAGKDSGMLKIFEVIQAEETSDDIDSDADDSGESDSEESDPEDGDSENGDTEDSDSKDGASDEDQSGDQTDSSDDSAEEDSDQDDEDKTDPSDTPEDDLNDQNDPNNQENNSDQNSLPLKKKTKQSAPVDVIAEALEKDDLPFFPYLDLGVSAELNDGQWVVAVGHPGGLNEKRGMVVRVGRIINQRDSAIRTDCTLVGGDSGGPLVDMDGNLIAIHSRIGSRLQDNLHVPVDVYSDTWDMLISGYKIGERGRLGLDTSSGSTIVTRISRRGPADKAGIQVGDIITAIGDKRVTSRSEIGRALINRYAYETVTITVRRGSNEVEVDVMLGEGGSQRSGRRPR